MKNKVAVLNFPGYKELLQSLQKEINDFEILVKTSGVVMQWRIGRNVDRYILKNKIRAERNAFLIGRLAMDMGRDKSTLYRALKIYRLNPKVADLPLMSLDHVNRIITIKDVKERQLIIEKAIRQQWSPQKLQSYLKTKREPGSIAVGRQTIPKLSYTRGRLHIYQVVRANKMLEGFAKLALDLGFREQANVPGKALSVKEGDIVELNFKDKDLIQTAKASVSLDELFTYRAGVEKIIDGDTLVVSLDFKMPVSLGQKMRLRGIDCPELGTQEGKRAKRFVESRLKDCDFIIVKTFKDRSDKFDRYLADIFYKSGEADAHAVAREGAYLNQELLNAGLAVPWPSR